jgi:hypothetical protein
MAESKEPSHPVSSQFLGTVIKGVKNCITIQDNLGHKAITGHNVTHRYKEISIL